MKTQVLEASWSNANKIIGPRAPTPVSWSLPGLFSVYVTFAVTLGPTNVPFLGFVPASRQTHPVCLGLVYAGRRCGTSLQADCRFSAFVRQIFERLTAPEGAVHLTIVSVVGTCILVSSPLVVSQSARPFVVAGEPVLLCHA